MNRKFARLQLNFVASSPITDDIPPRRSKTRLSFLAFMPESFYSRARSSSRMTISTHPVFYGFKKKSRNRNWKTRRRRNRREVRRFSRVRLLNNSGRSPREKRRTWPKWKERVQDGGKKKGAATGGSQRVSVKERFKASLILVLNDEIGNDRRMLRTH